MAHGNLTIIGFLLLTTFTAAMVGCNEKISEPGSKADSFGKDIIAEQIPTSEKNVTSFVCVRDSSENILGYRVEMQLKSRSGKFDIMVELDRNACVIDAVVTNYPAQRGRRVRSKSFTDQFKGKCSGDTLELGKDIDAISGATLSAKAMTDGVKKAVILANKARRHSNQLNS